MDAPPPGSLVSGRGRGQRSGGDYPRHKGDVIIQVIFSAKGEANRRVAQRLNGIRYTGVGGGGGLSAGWHRRDM